MFIGESHVMFCDVSEQWRGTKGGWNLRKLIENDGERWRYMGAMRPGESSCHSPSGLQYPPANQPSLNFRRVRNSSKSVSGCMAFSRHPHCAVGSAGATTCHLSGSADKPSPATNCHVS